MKRILLLAAAWIVIGLFAATARAAVIYSENFSGAGVPLHGKAPTVDNNGGGNAWTARTDDGTATGTGIVFYDDGSILGTEAVANGTFGNATLPFSPQSGLIYTLDVSLGGVTVPDGSANWVAVGFAEGGTTTGTGNGDRFIGPGGSAGNPWMLYRGSGAPADQLDQTFTGTGTTGGQDWPVPVVASRGAAVDLRIVLDTRGALWDADWYAKLPADVSYTLLRSETYGENPSIGAVGYAFANNNVTGTINSLELTAVPEPSTLGMGVVMALGVIWLRSRK